MTDIRHPQRLYFCLSASSRHTSIRTSTERPEAMDKGVFTIGCITTEQVLQAVDLAVEMHTNGDDALNVPAYDDKNVSTKVVKLIQSYTGIINKMVWRK